MGENATSASPDEGAHAHHQRNTALLATVELGWGLALALLNVDVLMPVLLDRLGVGPRGRALLPVVRYGGSFIFGLPSPYLTEAMPWKRGLVWALHHLNPLVWLLLGAWLYFGKPSPGLASVATFYGFWSVGAASIGFLAPLWYDYMGKITDPVRRGSAFSTIFAMQSIGGLAGTLIADRAFKVGAVGTDGFALCFFGAAIAAGLSNQAFLGTREKEGAAPPARSRVFAYLAGLVGLIRNDRSFRRYLGVRSVTSLSFAILTNWTVQADKQIPGCVGSLNFTVVVGTLLTSLAAQRWSDRIGQKPFLIMGWVTLALAGLLVAMMHNFDAPGLTPYIVAGLLIGAYNAAEWAASATFVMNLAPEGKRASYLVAEKSALILPQVLVPVVGGHVIEATGAARVQVFAGVFLVLAAAFLALFVPERRPR